MSEIPPPASSEKVHGLDPLALLAHVSQRPRTVADEGVKRVGDYELISQIAEGGMGVVWRAKQVSLQRMVAVKMIRSGLLATPAEVQRFRREAEAAASLDHPNIVPIYEIGEDGERHYFSMKLIEGGNLADLTADCGDARRKSAEWTRRAAGLVTAMARAVHHAHQRGLLHRDVKPTNVLLDERGEPHLTDFGLAKLMEHSRNMTLTVAVMGTPAYMSPEQAAGKLKDLTIATDIYGLGAVLYELLTGRPPFEGDTTLEILRQVQEREPLSLRKFNPGLNRGLETICQKCLQKEPHRRYTTAESLAVDLERWLAGKPIAARPVGPLVRFWLWSRRNPVAAAAGVLLLALAAVSSLAALRLRAQRDEINETARASWLAQAHMHRLSVLQGRRTERLRVLTEAARIRPSMEIRNEVIAALALPELGPSRTWHAAKRLPHTHQRMMSASGERYAIFGQQEGITVYRRSDDAAVAELITPPNRIAHGKLSPDGRFLIIYDTAQSIFVWDLHQTVTGPLPHTLVLTGPWEKNADFTPDSRSIAAAGKDKRLRFFDLATGAEQRSIDLPFVAERLVISPKGDQCALVSGGSLFVWALSSPAQVQRHSHRFPITACLWHPQGRFIALGYDNGESQLLDTVSGTSRWLMHHVKYVNSLAFDPQGELLASSSWDGTHRYSDPATGRVLFEVSEDGTLQATDDGRHFAVFHDAGFISAREIQRSSIFRTLTSPRTGYPGLSGVDFSPDSQWVVSGERAGLHIWDLARGGEVASIPSLSAGRPRFHPDGRFIITGGPEGQMKWPFRTTAGGGVHAGPAEVLAEANGAGAHFTPDGEWCALPGGTLGSLVMNWNDVSRRVSFGQDLRPNRHNHVVLSPDRKWVAGASFMGVGVTVWNPQDGTMLQHLIQLDNADLAVSPDGRTLATATAKELVLWNTETWQPRQRTPAETTGAVPLPVIFSRDGTLLAVALTRQAVSLLDGHTGEPLAVITPPLPMNLESLQFSSDGRYLAAQAEGPVIHLWDLQTLRQKLRALNLDW